MPRRLGLILLLGCIAFAGCRDGAGVLPSAPAPRAVASSGLEALSPGWRTSTSAPYACFSSAAAPSGPMTYHYRRISLDFFREPAESDAAPVAYRYRMVNGNGAIVRVLNCMLPNSARARAQFARRFGVPEDPGGGVVVVQGCVHAGECQIEGVTGTACPPGWHGDYPNCERDTQVECGALNPTCGSGGGGDAGGDSSGGSGGNDPCADCGPSTPMLSCTSGLRIGQSVSCTFTGGDGATTASGWVFEGPNNTRITGPAGGSWDGTAVLGGLVTAYVSTGVTLQATFTVTTRGWRWGPGDWQYTQGTAPFCENTRPRRGGSSAGTRT